MRNIFSADNIYQAGLNLFTPRVQAKKQQATLQQLDLSRQIDQRQSPVRQQRLQANVFTPPVTRKKTAVSAARTTPFYGEIQSAAKKHGINPKFLDALVFAESSYNPQAVSKTGAFGLTQIQPTTLRELGYTGPTNMLTPQQQIDYGAQYLNRIYDTRKKKLGRGLTPLEWYHAYSFGPNTTQPISPQYQANWERAYGRY